LAPVVRFFSVDMLHPPSLPLSFFFSRMWNCGAFFCSARPSMSRTSSFFFFSFRIRDRIGGRPFPFSISTRRVFPRRRNETPLFPRSWALLLFCRHPQSHEALGRPLFSSDGLIQAKPFFSLVGAGFFGSGCGVYDFSSPLPPLRHIFPHSACRSRRKRRLPYSRYLPPLHPIALLTTSPSFSFL